MIARKRMLTEPEGDDACWRCDFYDSVTMSKSHCRKYICHLYATAKPITIVRIAENKSTKGQILQLLFQADGHSLVYLSALF